MEVEEEDEEEEEEECTPTVRVATFAAGDSPLEAGLEYFRQACLIFANWSAHLHHCLVRITYRFAWLQIMTPMCP